MLKTSLQELGARHVLRAPCRPVIREPFCNGWLHPTASMLAIPAWAHLLWLVTACCHPVISTAFLGTELRGLGPCKSFELKDGRI